MAWLLLAVSTFILYWIYDGYGRFLQLCVAVQRAVVRPAARDAAAEHPWPEMTVLLTVHNEEAVIHQRITNTLSCDYPANLLKVLVASDGSTDRTSEIVRTFDDERVTLMETPGLGKTGTQNEALQNVSSDIVVFTDADIVLTTDSCSELRNDFMILGWEPSMDG